MVVYGFVWLLLLKHWLKILSRYAYLEGGDMILANGYFKSYMFSFFGQNLLCPLASKKFLPQNISSNYFKLNKWLLLTELEWLNIFTVIYILYITFDKLGVVQIHIFATIYYFETPLKLLFNAFNSNLVKQPFLLSICSREVSDPGDSTNSPQHAIRKWRTPKCKSQSWHWFALH